MKLLLNAAAITYRQICIASVVFTWLEEQFDLLGYRSFGTRQWDAAKKKLPKTKRKAFRVFVPYPYTQATIRTDKLN